MRDKFKVKTFVETGTYKGINAKVFSNYFEKMITIEKDKDFYKIAKERLKRHKNVKLIKGDSAKKLKTLKFKRNEHVIYFLDAHFYDPKAKNKFIITEELKSLRGNKNAIIVIHDFHNGLGHLKYDGQSLNLELIRKELFQVNHNFELYTNELASCDIVLPLEKEIKSLGYFTEEDLKDIWDALSFVWSLPEKTYRGVLYCLPEKLTDEEQKMLGIRKWS